MWCCKFYAEGVGLEVAGAGLFDEVGLGDDVEVDAAVGGAAADGGVRHQRLLVAHAVGYEVEVVAVQIVLEVLDDAVCAVLCQLFAVCLVARAVAVHDHEDAVELRQLYQVAEG